MYRFGHPISPQDNDPSFEEYDDAVKAAIKHQREHSWDAILAIYHGDKNGHTVCSLVFQCTVWE